MPVYEYLCQDCNRIFSFLVRSVASAREPTCPKCGKSGMQKQFSCFATPRGKSRSSPAGAGGEGGPDLDDPRVEREMMKLMSSMESMDENDPRAVAHLTRKMADLTGEPLGPGAEEAIRRMEAGEDPEKVEEEMGDVLEEETGGMFGGGPGGEAGPTHDGGLYDL